MNMEKKYAIYSKEQERIGGSFVYLKPDGSEVIVTCVDDNPNFDYVKFDDIEYIGEVTKFVKGGIRSKYQTDIYIEK